MLTQDEIFFLSRYNLSPDDVFDGRHYSQAGARQMAKELGKTLVLGSPCNAAGHRLRTRPGHCAQCDHESAGPTTKMALASTPKKSCGAPSALPLRRSPNRLAVLRARTVFARVTVGNTNSTSFCRRLVSVSRTQFLRIAYFKATATAIAALWVQAIWMTRAHSISSRGLAPSMKAKLAFTAISEIRCSAAEPLQ